MKLSDIPDDVLVNLIGYVPLLRLRLVCKRFAAKVPIHVSVSVLSMYSEEQRTLLELLETGNCLRLHLTNWSVCEDTFEEMLNRCPGLESLTLQHLALNQSLAQTCQKLLPSLKSLNTLRLKDNTLEPESLESFMNGITAISSCTRLDLESNNINAEAAEKLAEVLIQSPCLVHLNLKNNVLGQPGSAALATGLSHRNLKTLNLNFNKLGPDGTRDLVQALPPTLAELYLDFAAVSTTGAECIADFLRRSPALETLSLKNNAIGDQGAQALGDALLESQTVVSLHLQDNEIFAAGAEALGKAVGASKSLTALYLNFNAVGPAGSRALASGICQANNFQILNLHCNQLGAAGAVRLAEAVAQSPSLTELDMGHNELGFVGVQAMAAALPQSSIRRLSLEFNNIEFDAIKILASSIAKSSTLQHLNIAFNDIEADGAQALQQAISRAPHFQTLAIDNQVLNQRNIHSWVQGFEENYSDHSYFAMSFCERPTHRGDNEYALMTEEVPEYLYNGVSPTPSSPGEITAHSSESPESSLGSAAFTCQRCRRQLYNSDKSLPIIIYDVDRAGLIEKLYSKEHWADFDEVVGQPLACFMDHRLSEFFITVMGLIWEQDMCHTQYLWYCDDPNNRREMLTYIFPSGGNLAFANITVKESPHYAPLYDYKGTRSSSLHRCVFCGYCCFESEEWMEPEPFYLWLLQSHPGQLENSIFNAAVCEECVNDWTQKHDNPAIRESLSNLLLGQ